MPRLLKSQGTVIFKTPFPDEFQRYLCYELENSRRWNIGLISGGMKGYRHWIYQLTNKEGKTLWTISWKDGQLTVCSEEPEVYIRKGLKFRMGHGDFVVSGNTP